MAANQQKERIIHIGESDRWVDSRSRAAIRQVHCDRHVVVSWITPCSRAKVANKLDENSTTEVKYVNGSARIVG